MHRDPAADVLQARKPQIMPLKFIILYFAEAVGQISGPEGRGHSSLATYVSVCFPTRHTAVLNWKPVKIKRH